MILSSAPLKKNVRARTWRRFLRHKVAVTSLIVLFILCAMTAAAPLIESWLRVDAFTANLYQRLQGPSLAHPLGTDEIGRDHLARLLYGGRISLAVGLIAAFFSAIIGTVIGILAGYFGGRLDALLMRMTDSVIALPLLPLLIVLAAIDLEKLGLPEGIANSEDTSLYRIVIIVSLVGWTTVARLVRAETLSMRKREFVRATVALGAHTDRILVTHILPNVVTPIVVATTLSVGNIILFESVLSFLGLGIQPPVASWGNMLSNAQDLIWLTPALATWPGLMIFVTVIAFNFLGDGLQDALDPRAGD
jgi:peptide/nickel transport system permease protein